MILLLGFLACNKVILRNPQVYQAEINQWDNWAVKQSAYLRKFMASSCTCKNEKEFNEPDCNMAAEYVLTIEARSEWHKQKSLYLAELAKEPSKEPPAIPALTCPLKEED